MLTTVIKTAGVIVVVTVYDPSVVTVYDFVSLAFLLIFLYEITLLAIDVDNIGCLEPFLPL